MTPRAELQAAIRRTTSFYNWFKTLPKEAVNLKTWRYTKGDMPPKGYSAKLMISQCGTIGCLGGWLEVSPMMKRYRRYTEKIPSCSNFLGLVLVPSGDYDPSMFSGPLERPVSQGHQEAMQRLRTHLRALKTTLKCM